VGSRAGWIARRITELCVVATVACLVIGVTTAKSIWFIGGIGYGAAALGLGLFMPRRREKRNGD